jgi:hypothetical protein
MKLIIPFPANPLHVENLRSIPLLEEQGWTGTDASLSESLFCYGFAWRKIDPATHDGNDIAFIYAIDVSATDACCRFERCAMSTATDCEKEWNWCNFNELLARLAMNDAEWKDTPFEHKVNYLNQHHGYENVFGTPHGGGFSIRDNVDGEPVDWLRDALKPFADALADGGTHVNMDVPYEVFVNAKNVLAETAP